MGYRRDRGARGFSHVDKRLILTGASQIEPQETITVFEDFLVDVLADSPYVSVAQSGVALTAAAISATAGAPGSTALGGWVEGKTDDVDAEIDEVAIGGLGTGAGTPWMRADRAGNGMLICEFGFVIPVALTARQYFVGLSDDPTEGTTTNGPINNTTAYTLVTPATDAAGFVFSSLGTNPTIWKHASVKTDVDGSFNVGSETAITGVVDEYTVCRVEANSAGDCFFYQSISGATTNGRKAPDPVGARAAAIATTVGLLPVFTAAPTTTTGVEWEIDYCYASQAR